MNILTRQQEKTLDNFFHGEAGGTIPEEWRPVIRHVWIKYRGTNAAKAMYRRYVLDEDRKTTCKELRISEGAYFTARQDFILSAALIGLHYKLEV